MPYEKGNLPATTLPTWLYTISTFDGLISKPTTDSHIQTLPSSESPNTLERPVEYCRMAVLGSCIAFVVAVYEGGKPNLLRPARPPDLCQSKIPYMYIAPVELRIVVDQPLEPQYQRFPRRKCSRSHLPTLHISHNPYLVTNDRLLRPSCTPSFSPPRRQTHLHRRPGT